MPCSYPDPDLGLLHKFLSTDDVDLALFPAFFFQNKTIFLVAKNLNHPINYVAFLYKTFNQPVIELINQFFVIFELFTV